MINSTISWDEYFMLQALVAATRSKDPSTKVGSVIVDGNNHQVGMGYNGMAAGIDESNFTWAKDPNSPYHKTKYAYVIHAEANGIMHANNNLDGCKIYVTLYPCNECAKMIVSKKVKEVIYLNNPYENTETNQASKIILDAAGVTIRQFSLPEETLNHVFSLIKLNNTKK